MPFCSHQSFARAKRGDPTRDVGDTRHIIGLSSAAERSAVVLLCDVLLPAVDIVGRAGKSRVRHNVDCKRGNVGRLENSPDGKGLSQLLATTFKVIAEQRCRQRRVDEASGDQVDTDGRELEGKIGGECRQCGSHRR